jgi:hypothetical protein
LKDLKEENKLYLQSESRSLSVLLQFCKCRLLQVCQVDRLGSLKDVHQLVNGPVVVDDF